MTLGYFAVVTFCLVATGFAYFHARFWIAGLFGLVFGVLMALHLARNTALWMQIVFGGFFLVLPAVLLLVHAVDARKGFSMLPTIYFVPLAFACAMVLWTSSLVMLVWRLISS